MSLRLVLITPTNTINLQQLQSVALEYEAYTPYSQLRATSYGVYEPVVYTGAYRVQLWNEDTLLHQGTVEQLEVVQQQGAQRMQLVSRGLTAMLLQNQLEPGLHGNMSLDKLMTDFYTFPQEITWEQSGDTSNYIYVKPNASMWDGIVHLTYKLYGRYPFIRGDNHICMNPPTTYSAYHATDQGGLVLAGMATDQSLLYSDYYMAGADGSYGAFHETDPEATSRQLVRTKQLALDQQYLYDPPQALAFRRKFAGRRLVRYFVELMGVWNLFLGDHLSIADTLADGMITRVRIYGDARGMRTRLEAYADPFHPIS